MFAVLYRCHRDHVASMTISHITTKVMTGMLRAWGVGFTVEGFRGLGFSFGGYGFRVCDQWS